MIVYLTTEKADRLKNTCHDMLKESKHNIRAVATLVGTLTASFPATIHGPLHYRDIDMDKNDALKENKGNFDKMMSNTLYNRPKMVGQFYPRHIQSSISWQS